MNLYVWEDPYGISYGSSLYFAVANTEEEARSIAASAWHHGLTGPSEKERAELGSPTRVLSVPGGEWQSWEE